MTVRVLPVRYRPLWQGLLFAAAFGLPLALTSALPAAAQFVCESTAGGGAGATAAGSTFNVACGTNANASGGFNGANTAVGYEANASGASAGNVATGIQANASGMGSGNIAIGALANASGDFSNNVAIGQSSTASANSVAIGSGAAATFSNSAAFGSGATATRANQQVFGTATNTYTMAGVTSAASKAAQSGPTQLVTSDASGNLAASTLADLGAASTADINAINARIDDLDRRANKAFTGVAMAFAMAGVPTLLPNEKFAATINYGTFQGAHGFAINTAARLTDNMQLTAGFGYGADERLAGGRVGMRVGW
jgi:hypothetical protein